MSVQLVSEITDLCGPDPPTSRTDRRTDGQTTCDLNTALCTIVHRAVIKLNNLVDGVIFQFIFLEHDLTVSSALVVA